MLDAFEATKSSNIQLTIITKTKTIQHKDVIRIQKDSRITLLDAQFSRKELVSRFFATHHIFCCPTYFDSFNMTINEAIAQYMPVITTNFFSIPERIKRNYNGYVCQAPYVNYDTQYVIYEEP